MAQRAASIAALRARFEHFAPSTASSGSVEDMRSLLTLSGQSANAVVCRRSLLGMACAAGNRPVVLALLRWGADPIAGAHPERYRVYWEVPDMPLTEAAGSAHHLAPVIVQDLFDAGIDWNGLAKYALVVLCEARRADVVRVLAAAGADIDRVDEIGQNALMIHAFAARADVVDALIEVGADTSRVSAWYPTAVRRDAYGIAGKLIAAKGTRVPRRIAFIGGLAWGRRSAAVTAWLVAWSV